MNQGTPNGLEFLVLDAYDVSAIHLVLPATCFEHFHCIAYKAVGLRMHALLQIMTWVDMDDSLSFLVPEEGNKITVGYQSKNRTCEYELFLVAPRDLIIPVLFSHITPT